jgi:drug/metabolite transporter (DMT)-like permease
MPGTGFAVPALLVANLIWGMSFVATKPLLDHLPSGTLAAGRLLIALVVLLPCLRMTGRTIALGRAPAMLGTVGIGAPVLLQNLSLERTSAANVACLSSVVPAIAVVLAFLLLKHRPTGKESAAVIVSILGVLCILVADIDSSTMLSPLGDALALVSAALIALYLVLGRRYFSQYNPIALVTGSTLYALLMLAPLVAFELSRSPVAIPPASAGLPSLIYLGAGASALAFCLEGRALRDIGAGQVATFGNLAPVVGVVAAALLLHEALTLPQIAGAALALGGAWMVVSDWRSAVGSQHSAACGPPVP